MKTLVSWWPATEYALGYTLVHSLWQLAVTAIILSVVLAKKSSPRLRYRIAYSLLTGQLALSALTMGYYGYTFTPNIVVLDAPSAVAIHQVPLPTTPTTLWEQLTELFEVWRSTIVSLWMLGMILLLTRMLGGYWYLEILRRKAQPLVLMATDLRSLALRVGVSRPVQLLQSAAVQSPLAFGWLKPVILLPIGLVNGLSPEETEAVLLHELAHIARNDWVMNLLQVLAESLFYFHPATWWMSSVIRYERERCCDELTVTAGGCHRLTYARALMQVQQYARQHADSTMPQLALRADGTAPKGSKKGLLLERIQFILLQSPQQKSMIMERSVITGGLLAALTLWGLHAAPALPRQLTEEVAEWSVRTFTPALMEQDTTPPRKKQMNVQRFVEEDGKSKVEVETRNGEISFLAIDGKEIPAADYPKYREITDRMTTPPPPPPPVPPVPPMPPVPSFPGSPDPIAPPAPPAPPGGRVFIDKANKDNTVIIMENGPEKTEIMVKEGKVFINGEEMAEGKSLPLHGADMMWNGEDGQQVFIVEDRDVKWAPRAEMPGKRRMDRTVEVRVDAEAPDRKEIRVIETQEQALNAHRRAMEEHERTMEEHQRTMQKEAKAMQFHFQGDDGRAMAFEFPGVPEHHALPFNELLLAELQRDYLVTDPNNYSFELSSSRLKVNGKKQPANMLRKYLNLYEESNGRPFGSKDVIHMEVRR